MRKVLTLTLCLTLVLGLAAVSSAQLIAHYKLDDATGAASIVDASGNGFDGTVNGAPEAADGIVDGALEFFGSDGVVLPADQMGLTSVIGSVTFWMQSDLPTGIYTMWWGGDNTTGGGFGAENEMHMHLESEVGGVWIGGELSFYIRADPNPNVHLHSDPEKSGADDPGATPVNPVLLGDMEWHHVAGVWDGATQIARLYVDGIPLMEWTYEANPYELSHMYLGQMASGGRAHVGLLDDVMIFGHALTDLEIYNMYSNPGTPVEAAPVVSAQEFVLNQNYPNPFNPTTEIAFSISERTQINLDVYNAQGQLVETVANEELSAGNHSYTFNAENLPSGVYYCKLQTANDVQTRKMVLLK